MYTFCLFFNTNDVNLALSLTVWYACKFIGIANIIAIKVNTSMKLFELLGANGNQVLSNLSHKEHGVKVCLSLNSSSLLTINVTHETLIYFSVSTYLWLLPSDILLFCAWMLFQLGLFPSLTSNMFWIQFWLHSFDGIGPDAWIKTK